MPISINDISPVKEMIELNNGPIIEFWRNGEADCVLFYPGSLLSPIQYGCLLGELWKAGFSIAGLHLSGHGLAKKHKDFTFSSLLEEGLTAENWVLANKSRKLIVCGHSQGGILALAHAGTSAGPLAAFSLGAAFPRRPAAIQLTRFAGFARHRDRIMRSIEWLSGKFPGFPVPFPAYIKLLCILKGRMRPIEMPSGPGRISYPLKFIFSLFNADFPANLQCPWWLVNAKNDALFTQAIINDTFASVSAPKKGLIWLEKGGHMAPMNPEIAGIIAGQIARRTAELGLQLNKDVNLTQC